MVEHATMILFLKNWLSNFHIAPILMEAGGEKKIFKTTEHYFMWRKAIEFGDDETAAKILVVDTPLEAKRLGREVKYYNEQAWAQVRYSVMFEANLRKFQQHKDLGDRLVATGAKVLAEANPRDNIWGIGLAEDALEAINPSLWRGQNLLGLVLMEVRAALK